MKQSLIIICAALMLSLATACQKQKETTKTENAADQKTAKVVYTCPMHPEVESDTLGKCPKCGMTLEEKK